MTRPELTSIEHRWTKLHAAMTTAVEEMIRFTLKKNQAWVVENDKTLKHYRRKLQTRLTIEIHVTAENKLKQL